MNLMRHELHTQTEQRGKPDLTASNEIARDAENDLYKTRYYSSRVSHRPIMGYKLRRDDDIITR